MTKLMLAGVAALALSTGAAFAAAPQSAPRLDNAPAQYAQSNQRYDYLSQQQNAAPARNVQNNDAQSGYGAVVSHPFNNWIGP